MFDIELIEANAADLPQLVPLVAAYHAFEGISLPAASREAALLPLLEPESPFGRVWLVRRSDTPVGYVVVCFGFSVEFGGRDGFVDELYLAAEHRGQGIGRTVLGLVGDRARELGVRALHLEVARDNSRAKALYAAAGFVDRAQFQLMSWRLSGR
jgi:ribosomal protein S18 acetylase RimI-like enzyme